MTIRRGGQEAMRFQGYALLNCALLFSTKIIGLRPITKFKGLRFIYIKIYLQKDYIYVSQTQEKWCTVTTCPVKNETGDSLINRKMWPVWTMDYSLIN